MSVDPNATFVSWAGCHFEEISDIYDAYKEETQKTIWKLIPGTISALRDISHNMKRAHVV